MQPVTHTQDKFYVVLNYLSPLFDYTRNKALPIEGLLAILGIPESSLTNGDLRVRDSVANDLFDHLVELSGDENIGLHIGQTMRIPHLGILGMLIMTCSTGKDSFELLGRYQSLIANGGEIWIEEEGDEFALCYHHAAGREPYGRQNIEFCVAGWVSLSRLVAGEAYGPSRVVFSFPQPANIAEQVALFGCELEYDGQYSKICFPKEYADLELLVAEPELKQMLEDQALKRLHKLRGEQVAASPVVAKTKQAIAEAIAYGVPSVDDIAEQLSLSARTLQRQLEAESSGYKELLDEVRADLAKKYIAEQELSLLDVAFMLGFSEQSSFQRAFKRWFNATPGGYRRELKQSLVAS